MTCIEEYKEHIEYTFHAFCKVVIRNAKYNALWTWRRKTKEKYPLNTSQKKNFIYSVPKITILAENIRLLSAAIW